MHRSWIDNEIMCEGFEMACAARQPLTTGHVLLGMLTTDNRGGRVLQQLGVDQGRLVRAMAEVIYRDGGLRESEEQLDDALLRMEEMAQRAGAKETLSLHLLLGLLHDDAALLCTLLRTTGSPMAEVRALARQRLLEPRSGPPTETAPPRLLILEREREPAEAVGVQVPSGGPMGFLLERGTVGTDNRDTGEAFLAMQRCLRSVVRERHGADLFASDPMLLWLFLLFGFEVGHLPVEALGRKRRDILELMVGWSSRAALRFLRKFSFDTKDPTRGHDVLVETSTVLRALRFHREVIERFAHHREVPPHLLVPFAMPDDDRSGDGTWERPLLADARHPAVDTPGAAGYVRAPHCRAIRALLRRPIGAPRTPAPDPERRISIPPEEAYGFHDPGLVRTLPRGAFPNDGDLRVGQPYTYRTRQGAALHYTITSMTEDTVTANFNHPRAGRTLHDDVEPSGHPSRASVGEVRVEPLTTADHLRTEGEAMSHCLGWSSHVTGLAAGTHRYFRVLHPERATLEVRWSSRGAWFMSELRGANNAPVRARTYRAVESWIRANECTWGSPGCVPRDPEPEREPGESFFCTFLNRQVETVDCVVDYVHSNSMNVRHSPCFRCPIGRANRASST